MRVIYWDIETIARPAAEIEAMMPEDVRNPRMPHDLESPVVPTFEHKGMKDGPAKEEWRQKKAAEFHAEHQAKVAKWVKKAEGKKQAWIDEGALDPLTGTIALIGLHSIRYSHASGVTPEDDGSLILCAEKLPAKLAKQFGCMCFDGEKPMLENFWQYLHRTRCQDDGTIIAGFHSNNFDVRFAVVRSAVNRVRPKVPVVEGPYINRKLWVDLHDYYACGKREIYASINEVARALNLPTKEKDGGSFGQMWKEDKAGALAYLRDDDLRLTREIGEAFLPL